MKNLFNQKESIGILDRIDDLKPETQRHWGKMDVAQMLAHCTVALEMAAGKIAPPRIFIGKILGPLFKSYYLGEKPLGKNGPTDKTFIVADERDFKEERIKLKKTIIEFTDGGAEKCTTHPHSFFGKLTPDEWSVSMYKHLDHHLRQFGV